MYLDRFSQILVGDTELTKDKQRLLSLGLLLAAIAVAWIPHERSVTFFGIWTKSFTSSGFLPDFITAVMGVLIVLPLYMRDILKWHSTSIYSILSAAINLTLISTLCKIILGDGFAFGALSSALVVAISLSWLGMRPVAAFAWVAVFMLGIVGLLVRNYTMGIYGYLFILFGFLGLILHSEMKPGEMFAEISEEFRGSKAAPSSLARQR